MKRFGACVLAKCKVGSSFLVEGLFKEQSFDHQSRAGLESSMGHQNYDVVIIGGAVWGGSTAYHLLRRAPGMRICVLERDPSYQRAPSAVSVAGIRVLFSQVENLLM